MLHQTIPYVCFYFHAPHDNWGNEHLLFRDDVYSGISDISADPMFLRRFRPDGQHVFLFFVFVFVFCFTATTKRCVCKKEILCFELILLSNLIYFWLSALIYMDKDMHMYFHRHTKCICTHKNAPTTHIPIKSIQKPFLPNHDFCWTCDQKQNNLFF